MSWLTIANLSTALAIGIGMVMVSKRSLFLQMGNVAYLTVLLYALVQYVATLNNQFAWLGIGAFVVIVPFYGISLALREPWPCFPIVRAPQG
jgi:hypothetical protein